MLTAIVIASLAGLLLGGSGMLAITGHQRAGKHDAEIEAARTAQVQAVGDAVTAALSPTVARVDALAALAQALPPYCLDGEHYSEVACEMDRLCRQAGLDGGVSAVGCGVVGNQWVSERQLLVIEAGGADADLRDERRALFGRRK